MVNDNVLIKWVRNVRGHKKDWPDYVIQMKERMKEMKLGFPGIGNDHISLTTLGTLGTGDKFIYDPCIEGLKRFSDEAPIMFEILEAGKVRIEGIGCGIDSKRDPYRVKYRWMDIMDTPEFLGPDTPVFRVDVRPDVITGGPGYYYFYKSYRDFRV